jgi:hypothetical protein
MNVLPNDIKKLWVEYAFNKEEKPIGMDFIRPCIRTLYDVEVIDSAGNVIPSGEYKLVRRSGEIIGVELLKECAE